MINHYFKIAIRNFRINKVFSLINILGLTIGMSVFLLIFQYVYFEVSYDKFHKNSKNIYRIFTISKSEGGLNQSVYSGFSLGPTSKEMIPEIEQFVRIHPQIERMVVSNSREEIRFQENNSWYVDSEFLILFDFPLLYGDNETALKNKNSIVISEQTALKYFGSINCLGKELQVNEGFLNGTFYVSGVLKEIPDNSHLQFDILLPIEFLLENELTYIEGNGWDYDNFITYVSIEKNSNPILVSEKFNQVFSIHLGDYLKESNMTLEAQLQPMVDIHLRSKFSRDIPENNGNAENITFFSIIAILILCMAWANYINLSTVQAMKRAKEIGVKKIIGASKKQLVFQFLLESFIINLLAAILSVGLSFLLLPVLNKIVGQEISLTILMNLKFLLFFLFVSILGALLSGFYSAFILSSYKPINIINSNTVKQRSGISLRKGLIIFQFFISILLISGTYLIYKQLIFMKNQDLGLDIERILILDGPSRILEQEISLRQSKFQVFKEQVLTNSSISQVTGSGSIPGRGSNATLNMWSLDTPDEIGIDKSVEVVFVDSDFFETYDLKLISGQSFKERPSWVPNDVIINEDAVKAFGFGDSESAIGKRIAADFGGVDTITVTGVLKDFHWNSLKNSFTPFVLVHNQSYNSYYSLKIDMREVQSILADVEENFMAAFPDDPFNYYFLDEDYNRQYKAEVQFANLFSSFSVLALMIACLGLFALVSVSSILRAKEISIRKVLGANVGKLMVLLIGQYILFLVLSTALAIPVIFWGGRAWMQNFPNRTNIGIDVFVIPCFILFFIAFITVSYQTFMTANKNPIDSIKS